MESDLKVPLMTDATKDSSLDWNSAEMEDVKLLMTTAFDPYQGSEPGKCFVRLDVEHKVFLIVSEATGETLDIINPADVVGVAVEVELIGATDAEPRSTKPTFQNEDAAAPASPADCGIFKPLGDDADRIFSVFSNGPVTDIPYDTQAAAALAIYAYPRVDPSTKSLLDSCGFKSGGTKSVPTISSTDPSKLGPRHAQHRKFQVAAAEDFSGISALVKNMRKLVRPSVKSERLLVLVNPFSGKKKGEEVYKEVVAPMLQQAGMEHDFLVTTHARHAEQRMKVIRKDDETEEKDVSTYDGVVAIGGDGVFHEVMQGIKHRPDCDDLLKRLKFGHIGAGTSNGLSKSLTYASKECATATDYAFQVAKGKVSKLDLSRYETLTAPYLSFLTFSWAIIADIDIESEAIRFMGYMRMDIWAVWRVLNLRTYKAKLSYLPPTDANRGKKLPDLHDPIPDGDGWEVFEDEFVLFWASQVTHAAELVCHAPQCKLSDGIFNIFVVRKNVSRLRLAMILLAMESGDHVDMPNVEYIKCTAYRLEPISPGSFNNLDGEVIEAGPIQGQVLPGAIQVFCNL